MQTSCPLRKGEGGWEGCMRGEKGGETGELPRVWSMKLLRLNGSLGTCSLLT